jgi:UDP-sulfoquinovose synthase
MRVFIAGVDGYLGWPLAQYLTSRGHEVGGSDKYFRREWVEEMGSQSAIPIIGIEGRLEAFRENFGKEIGYSEGDLRKYEFVLAKFKEFRPEAIVHLAEMPSAAYSMIDRNHCVYAHTNNNVITLNVLYAMKEVCPDAHLVKLGTMGEYGTPNIDIPEGFLEIEYRGRKDTLPFPKQAGSWYHQSKVHDSNNIMLACRIWGLRSTDIMQGVVYGTKIEEMGGDERLFTRLDFDQCFGTVINRYCCQAVVGHPLSPYGMGHQKRGFLPLSDSMQCLNIAITNPPERREYRVFNQFAEVYDITELSEIVKKVGNEAGLQVEIINTENPRMEQESHYYNPDHQKLFELGYEPTHDIEAEIKIMIKDLLNYRERIIKYKKALVPDIHWDGSRKKVGTFSPIS